MLLNADLKVRTGPAFRTFTRQLSRPAKTQAATLERIIEKNVNSAFGRDHGFRRIRDVRDFQAAVPIRSYDELSGYIERVARGEAHVLTSEPVTMLATTSGTTGDPKLIPVTARSRKGLGRLVRLWMYRCSVDHERCFQGTTLAIAAPAVEGYTEAGLPFGSMSGETYRRLPALIRDQFAVPYEVTLVKEPDVRYFLTMRFALASHVTSIATANATTLLRLAAAARDRSEDLLRAIHDGSLGTDGPEFFGTVDGRAALERLRSACSPKPKIARRLTLASEQAGSLRPRECWPDLALIGCWLGGTAGRHAGRLSEAFGNVRQRDLGLIASEGRMTVPLEDDTPFGVPALDDIFFEFVPDDDEAAPERPLLVHELEPGKRYRVLITGFNGLYRYDMNDIVEAGECFRETRRIAFVRKGRDTVSITGEKVHVDQVTAAMRELEVRLGVPIVQFRIIPDVDGFRHDVLLEGVSEHPQFAAVSGYLDDLLARRNIEYSSKRASSRLLPPRIFAMRAGWSERQARADFLSGKREHQYKFACIRDDWDPQSRDDIERVFDPAGAQSA